jgi:hypothetical protein
LAVLFFIKNFFFKGYLFSPLKNLFLFNYFIFLERVLNSVIVQVIIFVISGRFYGDLGAAWGLALDGGKWLGKSGFL